METGTGKTYVYTKTIFELHKQYGFTKFIIVVPSIAIREGVYKSLQITQEHFATLYDNTPCRFFIYNSSKISVAGGFNRPYIRLLSVSHENGFRARIELDVKGKDGHVSRKAVNVRRGMDLFKLSGERELYTGYVLDQIDCTPGGERIDFTNTEILPLGNLRYDKEDETELLIRILSFGPVLEVKGPAEFIALVKERVDWQAAHTFTY